MTSLTFLKLKPVCSDILLLDLDEPSVQLRDSIGFGTPTFCTMFHIV